MTLEEIRQRIDGIDTRMIALLADRSKLVSAAGKLKHNEQAVRDPRRVEHVLERVKDKAKQAELEPDVAEEIYRTIIGCFVRKELKEFRGPGSPKKSGESVTIRRAKDRDAEAIVSIFNYYVEHGFAAYPDIKQDLQFFDFIQKVILGDSLFVLETAEAKVVGFGFLKKYHPYPAFDRTAEVGYFILPEFTRFGLGTRLLNELEKEAKKLGIRTMLANISSLNPPSLDFHRSHGFHECGRFEKVLSKFGLDMDIVWMQKML